MLRVQQRTITITPVVTRSLKEMQALTDRAFEEGSSARWWYFCEEQCFGLTSKERLVYFYFSMGPADRSPQPVQRTVVPLGTTLNTLKNSVGDNYAKGEISEINALTYSISYRVSR